MFAGELNVRICSTGTFAERIRCGGAGLGGCLTPTGVGTDIEKGKQKLTIDGKEYLLELPLHADVALIKHGKPIRSEISLSDTPEEPLTATWLLQQISSLSRLKNWLK